MKILMLCDYYHEDLQFQENLLTKYYAKHGHQVVVVTSTFESVFDYYADRYNRRAPQRTYYIGETKIIKLRYRFNLLNRIRIYTSIQSILDSERPDLIYVHDIMPNMIEALPFIRANPNCQMIMDYHADYSNSGKNWLSLKILHGVLRKWILDRASPYLSRIFPVVPAGIIFLNDIYKVPLEKMEVLPLGADLDLFIQIEESNPELQIRAKYSIPNHARIIVTGGKISPLKKTELLIQAHRLLEMGRVDLMIIGAPATDDQSYYESLFASAAGRIDIHFTGWLSPEDVCRHLVASDIAVFPASQSILWQQAIAAGLPLVVGNTGHQSIEYLNKYENIVILGPDEITAVNLRDQIQRILNDQGLCCSMSSGARRTAREYLDWNLLIEKTLQFNDSKNHQTKKL